MNRVEWMGNQGQRLYGQWTAEILRAADTPDFWQTYRAKHLKSSSGIKTPGVVLEPDQVISNLTSETRGAFTEFDEQQGISRAILLPHRDEILAYTSAADRITRSNLTPKDAVLMSGRDNLRFATGFSAGIINDVFLENTFLSRATFRQQSSVFDGESNADKCLVTKRQSKIVSLRYISPEDSLCVRDGSYFF